MWKDSVNLTTNVILCLTESVRRDINKIGTQCPVPRLGKGIYDSVWSAGHTHKLSTFGTPGRTWHWLRDFLSDRTAQCRTERRSTSWYRYSCYNDTMRPTFIQFLDYKHAEI